jgi:hypothetical protein
MSARPSPPSLAPQRADAPTAKAFLAACRW